MISRCRSAAARRVGATVVFVLHLSLEHNLPPIDALAVRVCHAIRDVRKDNLSWVSIDRLRQRLGIEDLRLLDAAVAFASAKRWLSIGGTPAHSVILNRDVP
jgi:hypothetical protein